jgi:hypothetical protein
MLDVVVLLHGRNTMSRGAQKYELALIILWFDAASRVLSQCHCPKLLLLFAQSQFDHASYPGKV